MSASSLFRPIEAVNEKSDTYLLQSEADLAKAATYAIEKSVALGAGGAIARVNEGGGINVTVARGMIENAVREGSQSLQITVFENGRTGMASSESLSRAAIDRVVEHAISMARQLEPDPEAGLADPEALAWSTPNVPLFAPSSQTAEELASAALAIEEAVIATPTADTVRVSSSRTSRTRRAPWTRSGRTDTMLATTRKVITASPMPISAWTPSMVGSTVAKGTVPETPSSIAQAVAPSMTAIQAPTPAVAR